MWATIKSLDVKKVFTKPGLNTRCGTNLWRRRDKSECFFLFCFTSEAILEMVRIQLGTRANDLFLLFYQ